MLTVIWIMIIFLDLFLRSIEMYSEFHNECFFSSLLSLISDFIYTKNVLILNYDVDSYISLQFL